MNDNEAHGDYTQYYAVEAEGHRIGLMICRRCGAAVLLGDEEFDAPRFHKEWHRQWERQSEEK